VQASFHQHLGPAGANQLDGLLGRRFAVRNVDNVHAVKVYGESLRHGANPIFRADKDWNDQRCTSRLECSLE